MDVAALVRDLRAAGFLIEVSGSELLLHGQGAMPSPELLSRLRDAKPDLIAWIRDPAPNAIVPVWLDADGKICGRAPVEPTNSWCGL